MVWFQSNLQFTKGQNQLFYVDFSVTDMTGAFVPSFWVIFARENNGGETFAIIHY